MLIKDLLNSPNKWCKNDVAVDKEGTNVYYRGSAACKWCLDGALMKCYPTYDWIKINNKILNSIQKLYPRYKSIIEFNDDPLISFAQIRQVILDAEV